MRANTDGSVVRLKDVARVELGGQSYESYARLDGNPIGAFGVLPTPTANTMATMQSIRDKMEELSQYFPKGMTYSIQNDTSQFVKVSIHEVDARLPIES